MRNLRCATCGATASEIAASDAHRVSIEDTVERIPLLTWEPKTIVARVRQALKDLDREGLVVGGGSLAYDTMQVVGAYKDRKNVVKWAKVIEERYTVEVGAGAELTGREGEGVPGGADFARGVWDAREDDGWTGRSRDVNVHF